MLYVLVGRAIRLLQYIYIYIDALVFAMWYRISLMPFQLLFPRFGPVRTLAIAVA